MGVRNLLLYYYLFFALNGVNVGVAWSFHYAVRLQSSEAVFYLISCVLFIKVVVSRCFIEIFRVIFDHSCNDGGKYSET